MLFTSDGTILYRKISEAHGSKIQGVRVWFNFPKFMGKGSMMSLKYHGGSHPLCALLLLNLQAFYFHCFGGPVLYTPLSPCGQTLPAMLTWS